MIVGHRRNLEYLKRVLAKGNPAHAYLFHGPEGVGKRAVALEFARSLLCQEQPETLDGCGRCSSCATKDLINHPDFIYLAPQSLLVAEENKREVGIKNARELKRRISETSWQGGRRVAVIDDADCLSRDAQAALLKMLEEPGREVIFILITAFPGALLETVRSRSVALGFAFLSEEEMEPMAKDIAEKRRGPYLSLAEGRPGALIRMMEDEHLFTKLKKEREDFEQLTKGDFTDKLSFSDKEAREPGSMEAVLAFLISQAKRNLELVIGRERGEESSGSDSRIQPVTKFLRTAMYDFQILATTSVNRRLLADSLFFDLARSQAEKIL